MKEKVNCSVPEVSLHSVHITHCMVFTYFCRKVAAFLFRRIVT